VAAVAVVSWIVLFQMEGRTTSIVLIGTIIAALSVAADSFPFVYGFVLGGALVAIAVQVFDLEPFFHPHQLLLSHEAWTPDRAGHQGLLIVGMLFLSALLHLGRQETQRVRERAKAAEAARDGAVADERARIARELHDVVSHHVTAMTLQAEAAAMTGDKDALAAVASAGRDALTELRRMLGVLRRPDNEDASLDPQPDLNQLDALADRTSSGPRVHMERRGDVRPLSAGLELGVYRLVQEALTNSAKHSDATTVDVVLDYGESELTVEVVDNGRPLVAARVGSGGLGLVGMQERIALLNGELATGPRGDAQGFRVFARLPIEP
jgi:signal transduction histidine kinase